MNMKSFKKACIITALVLNSCGLFDNYQEIRNRQFQDIVVINNSRMTIAFCHYTFSTVAAKYGRLYPDTLLPTEDLNPFCKRIDPMSLYKTQLRIETITIKTLFEEKDSLMFFIFSADTLKKYSWDEIREDYKILKRYDLSVVDLDSLNWTITYP